LALFAGFQFVAVAHAGPVEQLVKVAIDPMDPKVMAVRYTYGGDGIIYTRDGGQSWKLLCDSMLFDVTQTHGASITIALAADGTTLMGTFSGLWHDDTHACNWKSESKYTGQWIADFALDPLDPTILYSATSTASSMTSSGAQPNGLIRRDATGAWSDFGTKAELLITNLFAVKHGSGRRFYVSGVKGYIQTDDASPVQSNYVTRVSDDDGATWTEYVYGPSPGEFRLRGVDPTNPDRILASINIAEDMQLPRDKMNDLVLVSSDQGKTWKTYLTITEIGGVTFAPDGRVFIGDLGNNADTTLPRGVWAAANLDTSATKLPNSDYAVQCLGYEPSTDTLYACQHFWFGTVDTKDGTFTTKMTLADVPSMVSCDGVDSAAVCMSQLCIAYCGVGHFAQAPMCNAYNTPTCGRAVAELGGSGGGGAGGVGGVGMATGAGGTGGNGVGVVTGSGGDTGTAGTGTPKSGSKGGCCAVAVGAHRSGTWPAGIATLILAALLRRRRQR